MKSISQISKRMQKKPLETTIFFLVTLTILVAGFAIIGTKAANLFTKADASTATVSGGATLVADSSAVNGKAIKFGSATVPVDPPTTTPTTKITPGVKWDWIISGTPTTKHLDAYPSSARKLIDIDLENTSASTISSFKQKGIVVICYFSGGSYEDWRSDASKFPKAAIGKSNGWEGENWLDIRNATVLQIMKSRIALADSKGCDGVEPDNVDGYTNSTGFPLTATNQLTFNKALADYAHSLGLLIALKNDVDQVAELAGSFDFAINEECNEYSECGPYSAFIKANKAVLNAEYSKLNCSATNAANIDSILFALDLDGSKYTACR